MSYSYLERYESDCDCGCGIEDEDFPCNLCGDTPCMCCQICYTHILACACCQTCCQLDTDCTCVMCSICYCTLRTCICDTLPDVLMCTDCPSDECQGPLYTCPYVIL